MKENENKKEIEIEISRFAKSEIKEDPTLVKRIDEILLEDRYKWAEKDTNADLNTQIGEVLDKDLDKISLAYLQDSENDSEEDNYTLKAQKLGLLLQVQILRELRGLER